MFMLMISLYNIVVCRSNSLVDDTAARRAIVRQQFSQEQLSPQFYLNFSIWKRTPYLRRGEVRLLYRDGAP